jgi:hypothetical protein
MQKVWQRQGRRLSAPGPLSTTSLGNIAALPLCNKFVESCFSDKVAGRSVLVPEGRNVFIERTTSMRFLLAPEERNVLAFPLIAGNIALRWSADPGLIATL